MTTDGLRRAMEACASAYRRQLVSGVGGFDTLVLTATNAKQAAGYRAELSARRSGGGGTGAFLPGSMDVEVLADPVLKGGGRVGSGGATLAVLRHLERKYGRRGLLDRRTLLIHSGGLSQRLPAYSPVGKIFSPLPLPRPDGQPGTLFDHLFVTASGLAEGLGTGLLVMAGDVLLVIDPASVSRGGWEGLGPLAVGLWVDAAVGTQHGVFVEGDGGRVKQTLQKASVERMRACGAVRRGKVLVDTGVLHFPPSGVATLVDLARRPLQPPLVPLDLYEHVVGAMTPLGNLHMGRLSSLSVHGLEVCEARGEFLHLGTTVQFRDALVGRHRSAAAGLLREDLHASGVGRARSDRRVFAAAIAPGTRLGEGSVVEHSLLEPAAAGVHEVGPGSVVSQVRTGGKVLRLAAETLYFQCPLRGKTGETEVAHVVCGVGDDFKSMRLMGRELGEVLRGWGVREEAVWSEGEAKTMWTARLFPVTGARGGREVCEAAVSMAGRLEVRGWREAKRVSMAEVLERVDPAGLMAHREVVAAERVGGEVAEAIRRGEASPLEARVPAFRCGEAYGHLAGVLERELRRPLEVARGQYLLSQLAGRAEGRVLDGAVREDRAFSAIAAATEGESEARGEGMGRLLPVGSRVVATAPVRLDLAGGWSDTPPYCYEHGGHVVNVAVLLDGVAPVRVEVERLGRAGLELTAADLGRSGRVERLPGRVAVGDAFALHLTAVGMLGLDPARVGLAIRTECRVPKGSGLGTSSILAATLLAALHRVCGRRVGEVRLFAETLRLEQRLSTGGGWQDQVGGVVAGVKSVTSRAGIPQRVVAERLRLSEGRLRELEGRLVVYFTGRQRLARDILRRVVGRYLAREPAAMEVLGRLTADAERMRAGLVRGRWEVVREVVSAYWRCKTRLFPGSTNAAVDELMAAAAEASPGVAGGLAGAGGGGFAYFVCPSVAAAERLRDFLAERGSRPGSMGVVYSATIARTGLELSVEGAG